MAETALNFGPDWIRALSTGSSSSAPTSMPIPRYSLAEFRYGREEMLALMPKDIKVPGCLEQYPHLLRDKFQLPLALTTMTEDEQRLWSRSVNSEVALRASGKTGPSYGMNRTGRGGSVDRGRGRGRGGYYQRGLMHEESEDGSSGFSRPKVERSLSANEKDHRWDDRDRRYDRTFSGRGGLDDNGLKHDNSRAPNDYWRKFDKDDDGDWRSSGFRSSDKTGGRGSWRNNGERDRRDIPERSPLNRSNSGNNRSNSASQPKLGNQPSSWKDENQSNLPEWSVEETTEPDTVGTFDSSGAFLETKVTGNRSLDEIYISDDADEGSPKENPEAKRESSKKMPKKSPSSESVKKAASKQIPKTSNETMCVEESSSIQSISEPSKNNIKNSKNTMDTSIENVIQLSTVTEKQHAVKKEPDLLPVSQPNVPTDTTKTSKVKSIILTNVRNSESVMSASGAGEEDAFAHHQKATENMVAQWTEEIEEQRVPHHSDNIHPTHHEKNTKWFYQDPQGEIQGPFTSSEMLEWFSAGYFTMSLMVRRSYDEKFSQLGDLIKSWDRVPFMPGNSPPPVRVTPMTSLAAPINQTVVPNPVTASTSAQLPKQDDQLLALQQQLYQQQIMQQQLMLRQAQLQQVLAQLKQQDNFTSLTQQQQQIVMQQFLAQQQLPRPNLKSMSENPNLLDSMGPVPLPLLGLSMPPMLKNDMSMWQTPPNSGTWPLNMSTPQPPGGSIWDVDLSKQNSEVSPAEKQKKLAEEHEKIRKAEELRLEQEREMEEKRKQEEMRRKQEEMRMLQELQKKDEERKRLEEMQRQREEELRQEELKRLEEQRREEEFRKQEELKRLEELRKQEELQRLEELRKQEEENQLEELKKKEEQQRLEELKKQHELRKEEKRKKEEMQKKILAEKEREKQLELERQKEALRLKELEREERLQKERERKEKEEAEMRRIAELKMKSQGPAWGIQNSQVNSEMSLADIQRLQEEKEREEREEKMRKQLQHQQTEKQVQQNKNGLSWAKRTNECQPVVKSLIEIQQEEAERLAQVHRMQKPPPPAPTVNMNVGAWGNTSHLNKITAAPPSWNSNNLSASGFWDDTPLHNTQVRKPPQKTNSDSSAFPALIIPVQPAAVSSNKSKNIRAKKEEDAIARLFGSHHKPTDEFTKWCTDAISAMPSSVDVPTFVAFLKDIESPYEVYDYVKSYFGEGKEPREFAKQFLEKRSKYRNQAKQPPVEENTLWGPAPAITPIVNKTTPPSTTDCDGNSSTRGKTKKRKNRMQKLDNSMLGFTVQSNPDRLNVGEIDHIENM